MTRTWWAYVQQRTKGETQKEIAEESGIDQTVLSRWKTGKNPPSAQNVVQFARALGRPPVEALVAAGYLTATEAAGVIEVHRGIDALTDEELLAEVGRRMKGARDGVADETQPDAQASGDEDQEGERLANNSQSRSAADLDTAADGVTSELDINGVDDDGQQLG